MQIFEFVFEKFNSEKDVEVSDTTKLYAYSSVRNKKQFPKRITP